MIWSITDASVMQATMRWHSTSSIETRRALGATAISRVGAE